MASMETPEVLAEIEPQLQAAYNRHMRGDKRQPLYGPEVLARAASVDSLDILEYGPLLRQKFDAHVTTFMNDGEGVDIISIAADVFMIGDATEENIPYYTHENLVLAGDEGTLPIFVHEWTAQEKNHGDIMTRFGELTGLIGRSDMIAHEAFKSMLAQQLRTGTEIHPKDLYEAFSYLCLQEYLTEDAHDMTGWLLGGKGLGKPVMAPITGQEHTHFEFYLACSKAALELDPERFVIVLNQIYREFVMPGEAGIPHFNEMSRRIALAGVFDDLTVIRAKRDILTSLGIDRMALSTDAAKQAQTELIESVSDRKYERKATQLDRLRNRILRNQQSPLRPFILGKTVDFEYERNSGKTTVVNGKTITTQKRPIGLVPIAA